LLSSITEFMFSIHIASTGPSNIIHFCSILISNSSFGTVGTIKNYIQLFVHINHVTFIIKSFSSFYTILFDKIKTKIVFDLPRFTFLSNIIFIYVIFDEIIIDFYVFIILNLIEAKYFKFTQMFVLIKYIQIHHGICSYILYDYYRVIVFFFFFMNTLLSLNIYV
jgi:hypothetical protein